MAACSQKRVIEYFQPYEVSCDKMIAMVNTGFTST